MGSTTQVTDRSGDLAGRVEYDPYGNLIDSTLPAGLVEALAGPVNFKTGLPKKQACLLIKIDGSTFQSERVLFLKRF